MADAQDLITTVEYYRMSGKKAGRVDSAVIALAAAVNGDIVSVTASVGTLRYTKAAATTVASREFADAAGLVANLNDATWGVLGTLSSASGTNVTITASPIQFIPATTGGITVATSDDTALGDFITAASQAIANFTGRRLVNDNVAVTTLMQSLGPDAKTIQLPAWPIASITSIHVDTDYDFETADLVDSDDYQPNLNDGTIYRNNGTWTDVKGAIQIIWKGGHTTVPLNIKMACVMYINYILTQTTMPGLSKARTGLSEIQMSGHASKSGIPSAITRLLNGERRLTT